MERRYAPLASRPMPAGTVVRQPSLGPSKPVGLDDAALEVMTDLDRVPAVLVDPNVDVEAAMRIMVRRNVRSLFVVNVDNEVLGLVTATDLLGEKPLQYLQEHGGRRAEVRVRDIMTAREDLEVLSFEEVARARVGQVLETLVHAGRQHAMVVEGEAGGRSRVRGVFSASQLERQLGRPVPAGLMAHTFADLEAALAR